MLGFLVASAAFRWGPVSYLRQLFAALLGQRRPLASRIEDLIFMDATLSLELMVGGTRAVGGRARDNPRGGRSLRHSTAHLVQTGRRTAPIALSGLIVRVVFNGLRLSRSQTGCLGTVKVIAVGGFALTILAQLSFSSLYF